jgi:branched-chain amino acid transport system substrate-binding protein
MKNDHKSRSKVLGVLVCFWLCCLPVLVLADNVIKVGVINPLTGPAAPWGLLIKCSVDTSKEIINDRGGVNIKGKKYRVEVIHADDKYTVAGGRAAAEKLIYTDKVDFLVGSVGSEPITAWAPLATSEKKLAIVGNSNIRPKPEWPYIFRLGTSEEERNEAMFTLMKNSFGIKSVLYIFTDDLIGKLGLEYAAKQEKVRGLEVKGYVLVPPKTMDFYPFLNKALTSNPDYIQCRVPPGSVALIIKQARELGYKGRIGYPAGMPGDLKKWQEIAGVEASKGFVAAQVSQEEYSPEGLEFLARFTKACPNYRMTDLSYAMQIHVLMEAVAKAQSLDPDEILKVLRSTEFHSLHKKSLTASGEKTYGIKNHMTVPVSISMIVGKGEVKYLGNMKIYTP